MQAVLIVIHLLVAISLIFVIMLQRSEGGALGMGGGGSGLGGMFSARGAANTLTRTTVFLGVAFFVTSMTLTLMSLGARQNNPLLIPGVPAGPAAPGVPGAPPTLPSLPTVPGLPGGAPGAPAGAVPAPVAPATPTPAPPAGVPPAAK